MKCLTCERDSFQREKCECCRLDTLEEKVEDLLIVVRQMTDYFMKNKTRSFSEEKYRI